jgi:hypothetical protein
MSPRTEVTSSKETFAVLWVKNGLFPDAPSAWKLA